MKRYKVEYQPIRKVSTVYNWLHKRTLKDVIIWLANLENELLFKHIDIIPNDWVSFYGLLSTVGDLKIEDNVKNNLELIDKYVLQFLNLELTRKEAATIKSEISKLFKQIGMCTKATLWINPNNRQDRQKYLDSALQVIPETVAESNFTYSIHQEEYCDVVPWDTAELNYAKYYFSLICKDWRFSFNPKLYHHFASKVRYPRIRKNAYDLWQLRKKVKRQYIRSNIHFYYNLDEIKVATMYMILEALGSYKKNYQAIEELHKRKHPMFCDGDSSMRFETHAEFKNFIDSISQYTPILV